MELFERIKDVFLPYLSGIACFLRKLGEYMQTDPEFLAFYTSTTEKTKTDLHADWIAFKQMDPPAAYIEFWVDGKLYRWNRGETKRIRIRGEIKFEVTAVAMSIVIIFGPGIPDNTCCFEAREAPEYAIASIGSKATVTDAGNTTLIPYDENRVELELMNASTARNLYVGGLNGTYLPPGATRFYAGSNAAFPRELITAAGETAEARINPTLRLS